MCIRDSATVVHHHRGPRPKPSHRGYAALSKPDQRRVDVLSGLLRVADALDRSHNQPIHGLDVAFSDLEVVLTVRAHDEVFLERWAAERRKGLLAQVVGRPLRIEVAVDPVTATQPEELRPPPSDQVE